MKTLPCIVLLVVTILAGNSVSFAQVFTGKPQYQIEVKRADTVMGRIVVEMFPAIAPEHVRNWDSLVTIKFYDSVAFHRVVPGFVIQGGDPNSRSGDVDTWGYGEPGQRKINAEFSSVSHRRGILSAARLGNDINSATSQFFICVANATALDRKYSVYGRVTSGMDIVDEIVNAETDGSEHPVDKISMFITRSGTNDSLTATPQLVSPVNDSIMGSNVTRVTFRWNKITDAMLYRLQLATDAGFTDIVADTSVRQIDTSVAISGLQIFVHYYWRVMANNGGNASDYSSARAFFIGELSVSDDEAHKNVLNDVYPNPIVDDATIGFHLEEASVVKLSVLDVLGREVRMLIPSEHIASGPHQRTFVKGNLPTGVYFYRLEVGGRSITKRMIVE
jgi:peptidyl-prolyl cis-trans isomerase B (cyclophilin B)